MTTKIDNAFFSNIDYFIDEKIKMIANVQTIHNLKFDCFVRFIKQFFSNNFSTEGLIIRMQRAKQLNHIKIIIVVEKNIRHIYNHSICLINLTKLNFIEKPNHSDYKNLFQFIFVC